jgi:hypothetical protein
MEEGGRREEGIERSEFDTVSGDRSRAWRFHHGVARKGSFVEVEPTCQKSARL